MTLDAIYRARSCADHSMAEIKIVHNPENDVYGIFLKDDDGDDVCIALDADTMTEMAEAIIRHALGGSA